MPRTFIFGAKSAPGYQMAKLIIKLINSVGDVVNTDPRVADRLKVIFMPNFNVTLGEKIYPAAELSEQISLAGLEASGTGNMKFALNGAVTIGTLDGANIEIRERVGAENFFLFGLTTEEVAALKASGYVPWNTVQQHAELKLALDQIATGYFSRGDKDLFRPIVENLLRNDPYLVTADYRLLHRAAGRGRCGLSRRRRLDAQIDPQHRALRLLLIRSRRAAILRRHLEDQTAAGQ